MPGIVVFGRRWSAGSDDMVVPALSLVFAHAIWWVSHNTDVVIVPKTRSEYSLHAATESPETCSILLVEREITRY